MLKFMSQIQHGQLIEVLLKKLDSNGRIIDIMIIRLKGSTFKVCLKIWIKPIMSQLLYSMFVLITLQDVIPQMNSGNKF